jgi:hypothetical protein
MYLVTRDGKPLLYDTFDRDQMGNKALWESHEVTLFKRKEQAREAIEETKNYEGGVLPWTQAEHIIVSTIIYEEKQ